jgi:SAM-dependent MidA family methyltransferase
VGEQDITSHVDFTTLMQWGERLGLSTVWFGEQYRFLMSAGIMEELMALEARATSEQEVLKHRLAMKKLILPDGGMGDTFKVLIQSKGVHTPTLLCMRKLAEIF